MYHKSTDINSAHASFVNDDDGSCVEVLAWDNLNTIDIDTYYIGKHCASCATLTIDQAKQHIKHLQEAVAIAESTNE